MKASWLPGQVGADPLELVCSKTVHFGSLNSIQVLNARVFYSLPANSTWAQNALPHWVSGKRWVGGGRRLVLLLSLRIH
jgi:hypothetical protein